MTGTNGFRHDVDSLIFKYGVFWPVVTLRGEPVFRRLSELEASQWHDAGSIAALQAEKLSRLLDHCRRFVPFYQAAGRAVTSGGDSRAALAQLPFLTKHDLAHSSAALQSTGYHGRVTVKTTGGSTGQAVTVRKSRRATAFELAANWRGFRWAGIDIGHRQGRFWGVPASPRGRFRARAIDWVANRRRYSAFQFSRDDLAGYLTALRRFRPHYLYGYASMLRTLAEFVLDAHQSFPVDLRAVVSTSEPLTAPDRRLFQQAFAAPVFNEYGCGELGTIAHECEKGRLHIHVENLLVEIVGADGPVGPGVPGEVVVTELNNLVMPLVRYRLGDFAAVSHEACPCGRTLPTLHDVFGRSYDMIRNREGQQFHGEFFMYIFEDARQRHLGIDAFQVVQTDYDHVVVKVVPTGDYGDRSEAFVRERIRAGLGPTVDVSFDRVSEIRREKSGKMRLVVGMSSG
jgi:phenylacetate-CoA ligase